MDFKTDFQFAFRKGDAKKRPLLLLHGTGGNEHDLLGLADALAPDRTVISPRGRVLENGMPRFFRRFAEGVLDEDDIRFRANELSEFVTGISAQHGLSSPIALGFSNGANMAAAMLCLDPDILHGAILLRAMAPFRPMPEFKLPGSPVLLVSGSVDQMIPLAYAKRLAESLSRAGAALSHETLPAGHGLVQPDLALMSRFIAAQE